MGLLFIVLLSYKNDPTITSQKLIDFVKGKNVSKVKNRVIFTDIHTF